METIIYEYKNGIIELDNESETNKEKAGIVLCLAFLVASTSLLIMKTEVFSQSGTMIQISLIGAALISAASVYLSLKKECDKRNVMVLTSIGTMMFLSSIVMIAI